MGKRSLPNKKEPSININKQSTQKTKDLEQKAHLISLITQLNL